MSNIVNTPNRLFIRSSDATINTNPARFQVTLREPIIGAKGVQLQAARIPNALAQIPPYQRWFVYIVYDWLGVAHYRTFRLGATATASPLYYANYSDFVTDLNASAPYWFEVSPDSLSQFHRISSSLSAIAKDPDVQFIYNSTLRKIMVKNISPAPTTAAVTITLNENDRFLVRDSITRNWIYPRIPAGIYTNLDDLAAAIQTALTDAGIPAEVSTNSEYPGYLYYHATTAYNRYTIAVNGTDPTGVLNSDQLYAVAPVLGQPVPSQITLNGAFVASQFAITFPGTPPAGTIQFADRSDVRQMFVDEEIAGPGLYLNALVGIKTSVRTPAVPLVNDGTTLYEPQSWADLLRTQTIYIRSNLSINSTITTNDLRTITDGIAVNAPTLGIITYQASNTTVNWGVPPSINDIDIQLLDENLQPISLPENAATEFIFSFVYDEDRF